MLILAIDPGDVVSGMVLFDAGSRCPLPGKVLTEAANDRIRSILTRQPIADTILVIESFHPRGQPLYQQLIDTAIWTGRFLECWTARGGCAELLAREVVKHTLCGRTNVRDGNVMAALIDRYGGKAKAVGNKKSPGPLFAVKKHAWPALAIAVAWCDGARNGQSDVGPGRSADGVEPELGSDVATGA